jgi:long-chain acyl-CoA synthetase
MQGYYNKPAETAEIIKDGWLYTGDLGFVDKQGYLHVTGRKKEIIVLSNGKNVNPSEIEEQIEKNYPIIKEIGVFQKDDRLHAIILINNAVASHLKNEELEKFIKFEVLKPYNQSVASYKMVTSFTISNTELPRTRLGKIQRFRLAEMAINRTSEKKETSTFDSEEFQLLKNYIFQEKKLNICPTDHIEMDLGLDSLDKVGLQVFIESSFGVTIDISELTRFDNIQQICEFISTRKTHAVAEKINWAEIIKQKVHVKLPSTWITSHAMVFSSKVFFKTYFRFNGYGVKNIPDGPCIFVPNHQSFFDGLFVASYLRYAHLQKTFFYAKEKHVRNPLVKFVANRNNIIVMDLNNNLKESIQKMAEVLKKDKKLIIFPEGTRTKTGHVGDFKKTFAILSSELNIPIVPVTIHGAFDALPRGSYFPRPFRKIVVEFLQPVFPENHSYDELSDIVRNKIKGHLANL